MAVLNYSGNGNVGGENEKQYYVYRLFYNFPMSVDLSTRATVKEFNGKKYPMVTTTMIVGILDGEKKRKASILLSVEDWYRWILTVGELLARVKEIYVDNRISEGISEDDFKIVSYRGEVLQMIPVVARIENDMVPAVRIIFNDPAVFVDFPLVDIKSMHNVVSRVDVLTMSMCGNILADRL